MRVGVLGAGGISGPAIVRDLASRRRSTSCCARPRRRAAPRAWPRPTAPARPRRRRSTPRRRRSPGRWPTRRAGQRGELPRATSRRWTRRWPPAATTSTSAACTTMTPSSSSCAAGSRARGPGRHPRLRRGAGQDQCDGGARCAAGGAGRGATSPLRVGATDPPPGWLPYALQTLLDELTVPPVVVRDGEPGARATGRGGEIVFPEPIGRRATIHTLHSEVLTLPRRSAPPTATSASRWRRRARAPCATSPRVRTRSSAAQRPCRVAAPDPSTSSRRAGDGRSRVTALTRAARALGPRRRGRLDRARSPRRGAPHRPRAPSRPRRRAAARARCAPTTCSPSSTERGCRLRRHDPHHYERGLT